MKNKFLLTGFLIIATILEINSQILEISYSNFDLGCSLKKGTSKFVINSKSDLYNLTNCNGLNVDFKQHTIIGVVGSVGGCSLPVINFTIKEDNDNKLYIIEAIISTHGNCRRNNYYKKVILIDKMQTDYRIQFETRNKNIFE